MVISPFVARSSIRRFEDIYALLDDMRAHARAYPTAAFLNADWPDDQEIGWVAFDRETDVYWAIPVVQVRNQFRRADDHPSQLTSSQENKIRFLVKLVSDARGASPGRTLWERLEEDG